MEVAFKLYIFQTAYSMQWSLYLLSKNEEIQNELVKKIDENCETNLMKNIMREALRLYPVAPFLTRILPQDVRLAGYPIPQDVRTHAIHTKTNENIKTIRLFLLNNTCTLNISFN